MSTQAYDELCNRCGRHLSDHANAWVTVAAGTTVKARICPEAPRR